MWPSVSIKALNTSSRAGLITGRMLTWVKFRSSGERLSGFRISKLLLLNRSCQAIHLFFRLFLLMVHNRSRTKIKLFLIQPESWEAKIEVRIAGNMCELSMSDTWPLVAVTVTQCWSAICSFRSLTDVGSINETNFDNTLLAIGLEFMPLKYSFKYLKRWNFNFSYI